MTPLIRAVVDSAALRHNLARVQAQAPNTRVMAVLKANGYGHGSVPVAKALSQADGFAVARIEEGIALRAAGLTNRVLLLEGVFNAEQVALAAQHCFELLFHTFEQLAALEAWHGEHRFKTWIKLDSGMNRLGFRSEAFAEAYTRLCRSKVIEPEPTLVTHLANADDRRDLKTGAQLKVFADVTGGLPGLRSIANSAGVLGWPEARADWVRPGLALYGVSPFPGGSASDFGLRPAMTLLSQVIAVKVVKAGETVGYGGIWRAERDTRIAVVAAGYGDGYPRNVEVGTPVLVNGHRAPIVGRVSMDMITVDVNALPAVATGDPVVLWGDGVPVEDVARHAGTIPYELICGVSQRVHLDVR